jgi:C1A family cysteine protease
MFDYSSVVLTHARAPLDIRDVQYVSELQTLPQQVDLRVYASAVDNQDTLGSCAASSIVNAYELLMKKQNTQQYIDLSRLYLYYHARYLERTINTDSGVNIRSALHAAKRYGIASETLWPYNISAFTQQPTPDCYVDAFTHKISQYRAIQSTDLIRSSLAEHIPVVYGMEIYSDFMSLDQLHNTVAADIKGQSYEGIHAMCIVGYSVPDKYYIVKNSFGDTWADRGYCYVSFDYMDNYGFDYYNFSI